MLVRAARSSLRRAVGSNLRAITPLLGSSRACSSLAKLEDEFCEAVSNHVPSDARVMVPSAWLATDNAIVHLLWKHFPDVFKNMHLLAIDTLHVFPET